MPFEIKIRVVKNIGSFLDNNIMSSEFKRIMLKSISDFIKF